MGYTFSSAGTVVTSSSGAALSPVGSSVLPGNLLLLLTAQRGAGNTVSPVTGFVQLGTENTNGSLEIWGRVATGTSGDNPSVDWSGGTACLAWIEQYSGDVYADLGDIVAHGGSGSSSGATALLGAGAAGVTTANCLAILFSRKNTTAADATVLTAPASFTKRQSYIDNSTGQWAASASLQQSSATDISAANWTDDDTVNESTASNALLLLLRSSGSALRKLKLLAHADAQSKTGVAGVVFAAPTGGDLTGAKIGEFTGAAFSGTLEGGEAVIKVALTEFGGEALTTSDTPRVEIRYDDAGTIKGTAIVPATVIEE